MELDGRSPAGKGLGCSVEIHDSAAHIQDDHGVPHGLNHGVPGYRYDIEEPLAERTESQDDTGDGEHERCGVHFGQPGDYRKRLAAVDARRAQDPEREQRRRDGPASYDGKQR